MAQLSPMEPFDHPNEAVADYRQQARRFLDRSREYLAEDDLHQAAEKGWGAAAWMAKAVAENQGWNYNKHDQFWDVMYLAEQMAGDQRVKYLKGTANLLHGYFYTRKRFLRSDDIAGNLELISTLLDILEPLTESTPNT